jgi:hypothetical protein
MRTCLRLPAHLKDSNSLGWRVGWRIATLSFCMNLIVSPHCLSLEDAASILSQLQISRVVSGSQRTFNICNSVVFPALSRPRNRSFACLFKSPSDARVSQTIEQMTISLLSGPSPVFSSTGLRKSYLHQLTIHMLDT